MKSYQGHLLLAAYPPRDSRFLKAVILVLGHTSRTAFGVVVNRALRENAPLRQGKAGRRRPGKTRLYWGGPLRGPLMAVHRLASLGEREILPGVFLSSGEKNLLTLMRQSVEPCKIFIDYMGWGLGQLDEEVQRGLWRVLPAMPEQIFSEDDDLWVRLSREASLSLMRTILDLHLVPVNPLLN